MTTPPAVQLDRVDIAFGDQTVLNHLSLSLAPGTVTGLLGRNGAGKTTLIRVALGLLAPHTGSAQLFGSPAWDAPMSVRARLGYVPQVFEGFHWLKVGACLDLIGGCYASWDAPWTNQLATDWGVNRNAAIRTLSPGEQQKLSILLALGHRPDLLVLDEPVASLDPTSRRDFLRTLVELSGEREQTVLFSTHILSDLERIASDVAILAHGRLELHCTLDALKEGARRLDITARQGDLPTTFDIDGALRYRHNGSRATALVTDWDDDKTRHLADALQASVHAQPLSLESLFLELAE